MAASSTSERTCNVSRKPNVLLICVDHWPGALLGAAGHGVIQTPTLDQLARNGIRYTNAYTECPVCIPARRTIMTGTAPATHGDRVYSDRMLMPPGVPTLAQCFRDGGYQAFAVGKMHVFPQRARIGFDDVILAEEARYQYGAIDDYQIWLGERGHAGREFAHGMCNNDYLCRPWHLPEDCHVTNWATREMARTIRRRDPTRPGFYFLSYCHPHPPLAPLECYLDLYRDAAIDAPIEGEWVGSGAWPIRALRAKAGTVNDPYVRSARRAFYALCTHIDHQLRVVIGTLREEGILDHTILMFTCDHGDMLGGHGMWGKRCFYEGSARVPMLLSGQPVGLPHHATDDRLVGLADVMPTLLGLAGLDAPETCEGRSMVTGERRQWLFGEVSDGPLATRMVHDGRHKLIYYPVGNVVQLFDLQSDPHELADLSAAPEAAAARRSLEEVLISQLHGGDEAWADAGRLVGLPDREFAPSPNYTYSGQRGLHWPPPLRFQGYEGEYS